MKPIYKTTVEERIRDLTNRAIYERRELECILLTPKEYDELRCNSLWARYHHTPFYGAGGVGADGREASISTIELENPGFHNKPRFMRFAATWALYNGVKLFVVPEEFHSWRVVR